MTMIIYIHCCLVDDRLEDEDFDLIRENTGIEVPKVKMTCTLGYNIAIIISD